MQEKKIVCTVCPLGCVITVRGDGESIDSIEGYTCKRGETYAKEEFIHPARILTSTVLATLDGREILIPVRSNRPIPKEKLLDCMAQIRQLRVYAPVHRYDVLLPDILGTGADIIATGQAE